MTEEIHPTIQPTSENLTRTIEMITVPPFTVAGIRLDGLTRGTSRQRLITAWSDFNRRAKEVMGAKGAASYAIYEGVTPEEAEAGQAWWGVVGVGVTGKSPTPEGMVEQVVPQGEYTVFIHKGSVVNLQQSFDWIFQNGIPEGYKYATGHPDFEKYRWDKYFGPDDPRTEVEIYIPLKKINL